ncbi:hypothetical protein VTN00DRAFT_5161 [Thermoascus crustaceus]|uniref:uncharacterized protein n=1 Tax=Thermoascus crustaceus TaxID=5088 RepID=UPI00374445B6
MARNVLVTAAEGHTGFLIAELLRTDEYFASAIETVSGLALNTEHDHCKQLGQLGVTIVQHTPGRLKEMTSTLQSTNADTLCLIPPAHSEKNDITAELIQAAKGANIPNVCFISAAGCDIAERDKQPRLREFIDLEAQFLSTKGDPSTATGQSQVVIRAGFYAENLLLYAPQAKGEGILPIPIGRHHQFPPVSLGDVALLAAHVLCGKGAQGFDDRHRGQLMILTGPTLATGEDLANIASQALGTQLKFEDISEAEARKVLRGQSASDESEIQYILEYYSLVREGKTNYVSTVPFHYITGDQPQEPPDFFKSYATEFRPRPRRSTKKRRISRGQ